MATRQIIRIDDNEYTKELINGEYISKMEENATRILYLLGVYKVLVQLNAFDIPTGLDEQIQKLDKEFRKVS